MGLMRFKLLYFLWFYVIFVQCNEDEVSIGQRSRNIRSLRYETPEEVLEHLGSLKDEKWVQTARRRLDYIPNSHKLIPYENVHVPNGNFSFATKQEEMACKAHGDVIVVKKRIVLHLGQSGLGNRLLATVSGIVLSVIMDRVLVLDWDKNRGCGATFLDLFRPKRPTSHLYPLLNSEDHHQHSEGIQVRHGNKCFLNLDGHVDLKAHNGHKNRYAPFNVLKSPSLFKRLDEECDVIDIQSNLYFVHLLLFDKVGSEYRQYLHTKVFIRPFHNVVESIFNPQKDIQIKIDTMLRLLKGPNGDKKWLSIQARSKMMEGDDDKSLASSLDCANYLLSKGVIDYVFFASDSAFFLKFVHNAINKEHPGKLITVTKKNLNQNSWDDTFTMRDSKAEMEVAVVDWWLIGEADYCMSPSIDDSTFSKTSIARGNCKYIDYWSCVECQLSGNVYKHSQYKKDGTYKVPTELVTKEHLLFMVKGRHRYEKDWLLPMIPQQTPEEAWAMVEIKKMKNYETEQCLDPQEQKDMYHKTIQKYYINPIDEKLELRLKLTRNSNPRVTSQFLYQ